jgi:hypothetical protein
MHTVQKVISMHNNQTANSQPQRRIHLLALVLVLIILALAACINAPFQGGMGGVETLEMEFDDFDEVAISDAFRVEIRQGDEYRVTLEVDDVTRDYLEVNQQGSTLQIGTRPRFFSFFWIFNATQRAEIVMPTLVGLEVSDASHVTVSGFRTDADARFEVSDASNLSGDIETGDTLITASDASRVDLVGDRQDVEIEARDASRVRLEGEGRDVDIRASDASHVDLADFSARDADIEASDASHVTVDASGQLEADAQDASSVAYYGDPTVGDTRTSDASRIESRER